ncbi:TPA: hypothetical protein ACY4RW_001274 [Clostridium perfringens]
MNKEKVKNFIKTKEFKFALIFGVIMLVLGLIVGSFSYTNKINEIKKKYELLQWDNERLEKDNKELKEKVKEARPYFALQEAEQEELKRDAKEKQAKLDKQRYEENAEKQRKLTEGTTVFENDKVKINFKKATPSGMEFLVENKTDVEITIQAGSVAVNGISTDNITMSDHVAPKSKGIVTAKCRLDISGDVQTVSGKLRIIDFSRSFDTEEAVFTNVEIN